MAAILALPPVAHAQLSFTENFTGTTASGWNFGGLGSSAAPVLTANTVDTAGNGWLRMTGSTNNQATYALWDNAVFSVNAQIQIEMEYTFWNGHDIGGAQNGVGADGLTFFLLDAGVSSSSFQPGSYGGSLGYAALDTDQNGSVDSAGMAGGYLGFGFDNWGNYSGQTEGRDGGLGTSLANGSTTGYPNRIAVRGPDDGDGNNATGWEFIKASAPLETLSGGGQMDFPTATVRPSQTGADYRKFRLTLDANNQLTVEMKFGASASYITAFTADLSGYDRPEYFKIGFTAGTGGANETHEIRNVSVTMTPWQPDSFEWSDAAGGDSWAAAGNWVGNVVPSANADILFGDAPATGPSQPVQLDSDRQLNSITFDSPFNYSINGTNTITLGNTGTAGLPSINVNDYNDAYGRHQINVPLTVAENLKINNYSLSTLCINGAVNLGSNSITTAGYGAINLNSQITGSGPININGTGIEGPGAGIVTISGANGTSYTGAITVNGGQLVVLGNNALGTTSTRTTVNDGGTLTFRGGISTAELLTLNGSGATLGRGELGGALYNDGGDNVLSGAITLGSNASVRSREGNLTLSGVISGAFSLTKIGEGVVTLSNASNSFSGATVISEGALRVTNETALPGGFATGTPSGGNLTLAGGVLEIGTGTTFSRRLGTASDRVQFTGDGGFSAYNGARTVTLTNSGGTAAGDLTWGAGSFVPTGKALILGSAYADNTVTLTNNLILGSASREVRAANGTATVGSAASVDGVLSGILSGAGGINKTGEGTLSLTGANTFTGATKVSAGALRVTTTSLPGGYDTTNTGSNYGAVDLAGGVLELASSATFTRTLGTGEEQLAFSGSGGFSASGGARTVQLNNGTSSLVWGGTGATTGFLSASGSLILGSTSSDNTIIFNNGLDLNGGSRTVRIVNGSGAEDARLAQAIAGNSSSTLNITGEGRVDLTATSGLAGNLVVTGAEVRLGGASGTMASIAGLTVSQGGQLVLDNVTSNATNRVNDSAAVALKGGRLDLLGNTVNNIATSETLGQLQLTGGDNQVNVGRAANTGATTNLTFGSLARTAGATLDFTRSDSGAFGTDANVKFTTAPTLEQGILPYAVAGNGATPTGFATHAGNGTAVTVNAGANTGAGSWTSSVIAAPATDQTLSANATVGALILGDVTTGNGVDVGGAFTVTVQTGGILTTGATVNNLSTSVINVGGSGNRELIAHVYGSGGLDISASIQNNSNTTGLTKSGSGTLTLSGTTANSYTGVTTVDNGTLQLNKTGVIAIAGDGNAATADLVIGDGRGLDTVKLLASNQIADDAQVLMQGGSTLNNANQAVFNLGDQSEKFNKLTVTGNSVVDFSGGSPCAPAFLYLDVLDIASDAILHIKNWIELTDTLLVKSVSFDESVLPRIVFDGYGGEASWNRYDSQYYQIVPYSPVPEPATYGLLALGSLGSFALWRRRRQRAAQVLAFGAAG